MLTLMELQHGMTVEGNLDLTGRRDVIRLPNDLTVNGYLSCSSCINLIELPINLKVKEYLSLRNCRSLTSMAPVGVEGFIYIDAALIMRTPDNILPLLIGLKFGSINGKDIQVIMEKRLRGETCYT